MCSLANLFTFAQGIVPALDPPPEARSTNAPVEDVDLVVYPRSMRYIATHGDDVHRLCVGAGLQIYEPKRAGFLHRRIYVSPAFLNWFSTSMRQIAQSPTQASITSQASAEFESFVAGDVLTVAKDFHCLREEQDGVWELKTPDIRFFGWFLCKNCLILHDGGDANFLHDGGKGEDRYAPHVAAVSAFRATCRSLPSYLHGVRAGDVVSNRIR